ncbi:MAG: hypothetical protein V3U49_00765 [Nitrososphaerales archaeon]
MQSDSLIHSSVPATSTNLRDNTIVRSLRLWSQLDVIIQEDARQQGLSVNGLINTILRKYIEWDRYVEKCRFSSLPREAFREILEIVDDRELVKLGEDLGRRLPKDLLSLWFPKVRLDTFREYVERCSRYDGIGKSELRVDDGELTIAYFHDLGQKWSEYQKAYRTEEVKTIFGVSPQIEAAKNSIITRFSYPNQS